VLIGGVHHSSLWPGSRDLVFVLETLSGGSLRADPPWPGVLRMLRIVRDDMRLKWGGRRLGVDYANHGFHIALYMEGASSLQKQYTCSTATGS
jgi:hypothetical protein